MTFHQRRTLARLLPCFLLAAVAAPLAGQAGGRLTVDRFLSLRTVSDPQISPDGRLVAFTVSTPSLDDDRNHSGIWLVDAGGRTARALAAAGDGRAPRWAPDGGSIAFISARDGTPQVWRAPLAGGPAVKLTTVAGGVSDFRWAPDGKSLYLVADAAWPPLQELEQRTQGHPTEARLWTGLLYRHWNEWRAGRRRHLFRLNLADSVLTDLVAIDADVPTLALGGRDVALSPVGSELAVTINAAPEPAVTTNNDVFVMGPNGGGRQPLTSNPANDHSAAYSPDSRYLAYLATQVPGYEADRQQLVLYERATGRRVSLTGALDRSIAAFTWMPDARSILAEVEDEGRRALWAIEVPTGRATPLVTEGVNGQVQVAPDGRWIVFVRQRATHPPELWRADADGGGARPLTRLNAEALAGIELPSLEPFRFTGAGSDPVAGWLLKPPGFSPDRSYPLVYLIHGGPQSAWLDQWHPRWNYQLFAARGFAVALVNFHGSTGYGQAFTNSVSRNWGSLPFEDLMLGLDHLLETRPWIDRERVGAAGASYGGYMIYWMAGQTGRFRALAAHSGIFNPVSMAGSTEELWFPAWEFGGSPLAPTARAVMEKWSPLNYADRWATPMLISHGQRDYRVDVSEGFQAWTALRLRGVPGKFLYFPDEGHFVTGPRNRRLWWGTVLDWFQEHLGSPAASRR